MKNGCRCSTDAKLKWHPYLMKVRSVWDNEGWKKFEVSRKLKVGRKFVVAVACQVYNSKIS